MLKSVDELIPPLLLIYAHKNTHNLHSENVRKTHRFSKNKFLDFTRTTKGCNRASLNLINTPNQLGKDPFRCNRTTKDLSKKS